MRYSASSGVSLRSIREPYPTRLAGQPVACDGDALVRRRSRHRRAAPGRRARARAGRGRPARRVRPPLPGAPRRPPVPAPARGDAAHEPVPVDHDGARDDDAHRPSRRRARAVRVERVRARAGRDRDAAAVLLRARRGARHAARLRPRPGRVPRRRHALPAPGGRRRAVDGPAAGLVLAVHLRPRGDRGRAAAAVREPAPRASTRCSRRCASPATRTCTGTGSTRWATTTGPSRRVRPGRRRRPRHARARPAHGPGRAADGHGRPRAGRGRSGAGGLPRRAVERPAAAPAPPARRARRATCSCTPSPARPRRWWPGSGSASATEPRCTRSPISWPPGGSATPARACAPGSPTSACSPRRAGRRGCAPRPARSSASAATTAACTPTRWTPGSASSELGGYS